MLAVKSVINLSSTLPIRLMLVIKAKNFSFAVLPMLKRRDLRLPYGVVTLAQSLFEHLFDATQLAIFSPNQSDFIKNPYRSFVTSQHSFFLQLIDVQHLIYLDCEVFQRLPCPYYEVFQHLPCPYYEVSRPHPSPLIVVSRPHPFPLIVASRPHPSLSSEVAQPQPSPTIEVAQPPLSL